MKLKNNILIALSLCAAIPMAHAGWKQSSSASISVVFKQPTVTKLECTPASGLLTGISVGTELASCTLSNLSTTKALDAESVSISGPSENIEAGSKGWNLTSGTNKLPYTLLGDLTWKTDHMENKNSLSQSGNITFKVVNPHPENVVPGTYVTLLTVSTRTS